MAAFVIYILKSTLCLSVFYLWYRLLFRGTTHFRFNRQILVLGLLVCSLLPLIHFTLEKELPVHRPLRMLDEALTIVALPEKGQAEVGAIVPADTGEGVFLYPRFFFFLYAGGCAFVLCLFLSAYIRMWRLIRGASTFRESGVCWALTDRQVSPFSWGNYIVMNRKDYEAYPLIRLHEQMHVLHGHSWDGLLVQLLKVFHWFNPVVWLWQKELRDLHEYQADHEVISRGIDVKTYQLLLVEKAVGTRLYSMACGFDHCSLKKRITMMMKRKTPGWKRLYILIAFPLAAGAVFVFAQPKVDATLQTVVAGQATACDSSSLDISLSAADYAGLAADAVAFDVYVNQRNQLMIGAFNKMDAVKLEGLADAVSKRLVADFSSRYAKRKEVPEMVACITADRNAKMGCVYEAKQQISRGYELAVRELSATYPAGVLQHSLSSRIVYNPPRSYGNPVAGVSDKNQRLEGFGITIFMEGEKKGSLKDFTLQELESEIASLLEGADVSKNMISVELSVPKDVQEGIMYDVKQVLRKLYLLKVDTVH